MEFAVGQDIVLKGFIQRCQQPRSGDPPFDGARRSRGLNDAIAPTAGMLFTDCPGNPEGAAHQLQLFGGILTQVTQRTTALRATRLSRQQPLLIPWE